MDVEDRLAGVGVAVEDRAEAAFAVAVIGRSAAPRRIISPTSPSSSAVSSLRLAMWRARDHEHVQRRLRVDVPERDHAVVLIHQRCGDVSADDLQKRQSDMVASD